MSESSGLIAFNQKVSRPGEAVSHNRPQQRIPGMSNGKRDHQRTQPEQGACGMHRAIARVTVLMQVEGQKLVVTGKLSCGILDSP